MLSNIQKTKRNLSAIIEFFKVALKCLNAYQEVIETKHIKALLLLKFH